MAASAVARSAQSLGVGGRHASTVSKRARPLVPSASGSVGSGALRQAAAPRIDARRSPARLAVATVEPSLEEEAQKRVPLAVVAADLESVLPAEHNDDLFGSDSEEEARQVPRSFASLFTDEEDEEVAVVDPSLLIANCGLSEKTVNALEARGISALFPIQKTVFEPAMAGHDLIARAKTGSGKTLAFAIPVIEKILAGPKATGKAQCLVLAPTRELAKQVEREIATTAPALRVGCYYGGNPIGPQLKELRRGVEIVVGTPGRIIDLIDQDALDLSEVRFVVLDEADQMLNVGFEKDVETILENVPEERQTMLFSATVPKWVKKLVKQYLNTPVDIDLVGEGQSGKMADSITALAVQVPADARRSVLVDLLTVYGEGGKAIVFTQTKREADEVAASVGGHLPCGALHGDMSQREREKVLASFRDKKLTVLVATDVAARGLDIPDVDLVVHYELPQDPESFLHRSGRTGRAGKSGTAIAMFQPKEIGYFKRILRETETEGVKLISAPSPTEVIEAAAKQVMYRLDGVDAEVRSYFGPVARMLLAERDPQEALEAALAALSGIQEIPEPRSLLTMEEGVQTLLIMSKPGRITRPSHVSAIVAKLLEGTSHSAGAVGRIRMMVEGEEEGAAFDVPCAVAAEILARVGELHKRGVNLTAPTALAPEEDLYHVGRGGRGGRGRNDDSSFFERRRMQGGRGGGSRYGDRDGGRRDGGRSFGDRREGSRSYGDRREGGRSYGERREGGGRGERRDGGRGGRGDFGSRRERTGSFDRERSGSFDRRGASPGWDLSDKGGCALRLTVGLKGVPAQAAGPAKRRSARAAAAQAEAATQRLTKDDLVAYLASGCKPRDQWRIGTEHEKLGYNMADSRRLTYEQIAALLTRIQERFGWQPIIEDGNIIGLTQDGQSVTLEPGGQFELSGATLDTLHKTCAEVNSHLYQVRSISEEMGIAFLGVGFDPKWRYEDVPRMPKARYAIMRDYMPTRGTLGRDMMFRSCTVQVNLDFESEEDMVQKMRIGMALQPVATALFANSPFKEGKPTGYLSWRSHVWTDTDPDRCGTLPFVFEEGFGFERYVDYVLDVPMYFVYRNGTYHSAAGQSFRDFLQGKLPALPGELPTLQDWESHLTTVFPEVRLKRFLEMRGADGGPWRLICGLPALWVGLLYDEQAQAEALELISDWTHEEREFLRDEVPRSGLRTPFRGGTMQDLAQRVLEISRGGLERRGKQETKYLKELEVIAESGVTQADHLLSLYHGEWNESVDPIYSPQSATGCTPGSGSMPPKKDKGRGGPSQAPQAQPAAPAPQPEDQCTLCGGKLDLKAEGRFAATCNLCGTASMHFD
ncbi:glutamate--cysteine chloroplastic isoform A [Chlorella sorokiniana]|uniref:Glutamate--cysteine chloroplastic isoform A n=1 Tax=Chlorella sorokiniana TaxID=3076 RepID=A0A2P6TEJ4_CHLSO|nr:glutamate--cysteine chloroplastic isoform A [Chlorella sorokiniana]|eukprot:PRW21064.1 glutamate--cysteine chloroplastic isoform A [Chlorella sorokiniana]